MQHLHQEHDGDNENGRQLAGMYDSPDMQACGKVTETPGVKRHGPVDREGERKPLNKQQSKKLEGFF